MEATTLTPCENSRVRHLAKSLSVSVFAAGALRPQVAEIGKEAAGAFARVCAPRIQPARRRDAVRLAAGERPERLRPGSATAARFLLRPARRRPGRAVPEHRRRFSVRDRSQPVEHAGTGSGVIYPNLHPLGDTSRIVSPAGLPVGDI